MNLKNKVNTIFLGYAGSNLTSLRRLTERVPKELRSGKRDFIGLELSKQNPSCLYPQSQRTLSVNRRREVGLPLLYSLIFSFLFFSSFNTPDSYYTQSASSFFSSGIADKTLTLSSADPELLNATVFHTINQLREKKGKLPFEYSPELNKVAQSYLEKMEKRKFTNPEAIQSKYVKIILNDAKAQGFKGTLVNMNAQQYQAIDYNGKEFFYNRKDSTTQLKLFYGKMPVKNEKHPERDSISCYTYKAFAEQIVDEMLKNDKQKVTLSKAYKFSSCVLQWDYSTLYKRKIPQIKLIQVAGGFQTDLMQEED